MNVAPQMPALLKGPQLAKALGLGHRKVLQLTAAEEIPVIRLSCRCFRYELSSVVSALRNKFEQGNGGLKQ